MKHGPALPVVNRAGRGFHPRPERSTPAKYLLGFSLSTFCCRCSKSSSRLYRSSTAPVGDCIPDRNDPPPPNTHLRFRIRPPLPCPTLPISLAPPMLLRGWIVPVGGSTPDRHKVGTLHPCWLRNADYQIPVRNIGQNLPPPVGNNAGRGLNPRPERSTPAKYSPTLPNSASSPLPNPSHFPRPSNALAWMDLSGRGYNPRPAQTRPAQGHRLKNDNRHPPPLPQNLPRPL